MGPVGLTGRASPCYCSQRAWEATVSKIVLCVDDSATMQQVADITFRNTDFQYVGARTVEEAISKAKSHKPAVVLADAQMPGKNGYDLCMTLKSDAGLSDVPVVILVGNAAPFDAARGAQVGADANLPKPWDTQIMLEKVTEIVAKGAQAKPGQAPTPVAATASAPAARPAPVAAVAAAAANASKEPPRSATIMGMPTIKMPPGVAPTVTPAAPSKTTAMAVPPMAPEAVATVPGAGGGLRPPAAASKPTSVPSPAATPSTAPIGGMNRGPMVAGTPTKRSALVERTLAKMAARIAEIAGVEPGSPELLALLKLSTEVVERIVWEVVPDLAEQIIRENLSELSAKRSS
ncbi:MAG TPA: response regulator [Kofleriaceae bacterium]